MRKTKIICTLGPAVDTEEKLELLMKNGMDCARFNFSHGTHEEQKVRMDRLRKVRENLDLPIPILLDTKGPEIRLKTFKEGKVEIVKDQIFTLKNKEIEGTNTEVSVSYKELYLNVKPGTNILIDDGKVSLSVEKIDGKDVVCKVLVGGKLSNRKSINIPNIMIPMDYISDVDYKDIMFGVEQKVDFLALSFVRTPQDVLDVRKILEENDASQIKIISKIENMEGIKNLEGIIKVSDGIMVARGDMGVEVAFTKIPQIQKKMIEKCYRAGKIVITATQMLESMIQNPRPTRAEVSDVANAIYDGTTCIMLSGESAAGNYPIESVSAMAAIAAETETSINYKENFANNQLKLNKSVPNAISTSVCDAAHYIDAKAIIAISKMGITARTISSNYPAIPIIAEVVDEVALRQLNLCFAVKPVKAPLYSNVEDMFAGAVALAEKTEMVKKGDTVVISGGSIISGKGSDMLKIQKI